MNKLKEFLELFFAKRKFPKMIKRVYLYMWFGEKDSPYCNDLWKEVSWDIGEIIPMIRKNKWVAFYKLTRAYREGGSSMSDWALGDDGRYRDFRLHHIEKIGKRKLSTI